MTARRCCRSRGLGRGRAAVRTGMFRRESPEDRRLPPDDPHAAQWPREVRRYLEMGMVRHRPAFVAVRGERLALSRLEVGTADVSPGAPQDELLQLVGLDEEGRIALQVWFDVEDIDAAIAELDAVHARFEERPPRTRLENAASRADDRFNTLFADRRWDEIGALFADDVRVEDRRRGLQREGTDRATELAEVRAIADLGVKTMTSTSSRSEESASPSFVPVYSGRDDRPGAFHTVDPPHRRDRRRRADRGVRRVRPRRHRRRLRRARRPVPRRRRPPPYADTWSILAERLRRPSAGTSCRRPTSGLRQHRPPPDGSLRAR